jgi:hypothetical protein
MIKPSVGKYVRKRHSNPSLDEIFETIFSQDHMGLRLYDGWIYNYVKGTDCIVSDLLFNTKREKE